MNEIATEAEVLRCSWETDPRWNGVERTYTAEDVVRLRGSLREEHTLARTMSEKLWDELTAGYFDAASSVITGGEGSTLALTGSTEDEQFGE